MITDDNDDRWHDAIDLLCFSSARQILGGVSFIDFRTGMVACSGAC